MPDTNPLDEWYETLASRGVIAQQEQRRANERQRIANEQSLLQMNDSVSLWHDAERAKEQQQAEERAKEQQKAEAYQEEKRKKAEAYQQQQQALWSDFYNFTSDWQNTLNKAKAVGIAENAVLSQSPENQKGILADIENLKKQRDARYNQIEKEYPGLGSEMTAGLSGQINDLYQSMGWGYNDPSVKVATYNQKVSELQNQLSQLQNQAQGAWSSAQFEDIKSQYSATAQQLERYLMNSPFDPVLGLSDKYYPSSQQFGQLIHETGLRIDQERQRQAATGYQSPNAQQQAEERATATAVKQSKVLAAAPSGASKGNPYNIDTQRQMWYDYEIGYRQAAASTNARPGTAVPLAVASAKITPGALANINRGVYDTVLGLNIKTAPSSNWDEFYSGKQTDYQKQYGRYMAGGATSQPVYQDLLGKQKELQNLAQVQRGLDIGRGVASQIFWQGGAEKPRELVPGVYTVPGTMKKIGSSGVGGNEWVSDVSIVPPKATRDILSGIMEPLGLTTSDPTIATLLGVTHAIFPDTKYVTTSKSVTAPLSKFMNKDSGASYSGMLIDEDTGKAYSPLVTGVVKSTKAEGVPSGLQSVTRSLFPPVPDKPVVITAGLAAGVNWYNEGLGGITEKAYKIVGGSGLPEPVKYLGNVEIGLFSAIAATPSFLGSIPFATEWVLGQPQSIPSKAADIGTEMITGLYETEREYPGSLPGTLAGMYVAGKGLDYVGGKSVNIAKRASPIGIAKTEIPTSAGASTKFLYGYTKPVFSSVEDANIVGGLKWGGKSEANIMMGSKSFEIPSVGIDFLKGDIPSFKSIEAAKKVFNKQAEAGTSTFYHATNEPVFTQKLISEGKATVEIPNARPGAPLHLAKPDTVYTRFLQGSEGNQPGVPSIIRIKAVPKTVLETSGFEGSFLSPKLPEGVYPSTKPLSGWRWKGDLQYEYMIPSGSKLSVTDVNYVKAGGTKIPVIDVKFGDASWLDRVGLFTKKIEYNLNDFALPKAFRGKPTNILRGSDISLPNPLEEVPYQQWTPAQKALMRPYMKEMAAKPGANVGLRVASAAPEAISAIRDVNFVQREPIGQVLVGRDLSETAISKIYKIISDYKGEAKVITGGSTSIRANLAESGFEGTIGDIDIWADAKVVPELYGKIYKVIEKEIPNIGAAKKTFFDLKTGKPGKFPVGDIAKPGKPKPLVGIHSLEEFPHVIEHTQKMKTVGGHTVESITSNYLFERKLSASFDYQKLTQIPGGDLRLGANSLGKHSVGAYTIGREASSLLYGRDADLTGMTPSYPKGKSVETFSSVFDELMKNTKKPIKIELDKYLADVKQNPLELKSTKTAKAKAFVQEIGKGSTSYYSGIPVWDIFGKSDVLLTRAEPEEYAKYEAYATRETGSPIMEYINRRYGVDLKPYTRPIAIPSVYSTYGSKVEYTATQKLPSYSGYGTYTTPASTRYVMGVVPSSRGATYQEAAAPKKETYGYESPPPAPKSGGGYASATPYKPIDLGTLSYPAPEAPQKGITYPTVTPVEYPKTGTPPTGYPVVTITTEYPNVPIPPTMKYPPLTTVKTYPPLVTPTLKTIPIPTITTYPQRKRKEEERKRRRRKRITPSHWEYAPGLYPSEASAFVLGIGGNYRATLPTGTARKILGKAAVKRKTKKHVKHNREKPVAFVSSGLLHFKGK